MQPSSADNLTTTHLSTQQPGQSKNSNKIILASVAALTLVVSTAIAGYFIIRESSTTQNVTNQISKAADSSQVAPTPRSVTSTPSPSPAPRSTNDPFSSNNSTANPAQSVYIGTTAARFHDITTNQDVGVVTRFIGTEYLLRSFSLNLPDQPLGQTYQVWIGNSQGFALPLGILSKDSSGRFSTEIRYNYSETLPFGFNDTLTHSIVSLESTIDNQLETIMATADLPAPGQVQ